MQNCPMSSGWAVTMNLLLDTHTFLWIVGDQHYLSPAAREACQDRRNGLSLSLASVWEMQIKAQLGKLSLPRPLPDLIQEQQEVNGIQVLPVDLPHIYALPLLPPHHRDPFDRLIIAQAIVVGMTIVTADHAFRSYAVPLLW